MVIPKLPKQFVMYVLNSIHGNTLDFILTNNEDLHSVSVHPTDNLLISSDYYIINLELHITCQATATS